MVQKEMNKFFVSKFFSEMMITSAWLSGLKIYRKIGPMCPEFVSTATWVVFFSFCWWNIQYDFPPFFTFQIKGSLENKCQKFTFRVGIQENIV